MDNIYVNNLRIDGVRLSALAACVPNRAVDNIEFGRETYGEDISQLIKAIGVKQRRVAPERKVTALDMCVRAAENILEFIQNGGGHKSTFNSFDEFGGLVFVTLTPDLLQPNNATLAHHLLKFPGCVPAFDIMLACSGWPYGLYIASLTAANSGKPVLLLDGDTCSHSVSKYDKSMGPLFGDAGTAAVVEPDDSAPTMFFDFFADGGMRDALTTHDGGYRNRVSADSGEYIVREDGVRRRGVDTKMNGDAVFSAAVRYVPPSLRRVMQAAGRSADEFDALVLHQANLMMISLIAKKFGFSGERFPISLDRYGNVGSASVPLTICSEMRGRISESPGRVLISSFGSGFSVGSVSLELGPCACAGVAEFEC